MNYDGFIQDVSVGDTLLVDGGIMSLKLLAVEGKDVTCQVVDGGVMKSRCAPDVDSTVQLDLGLRPS